MLCGHCKVPFHELYWAVAPDMRNAAVPNAISRKRFRGIFSNFHLANNAEINADRYYKMRCLFDILNCNFKKQFSICDHSIDTIVTPCFWKHGTKQLICGKPIRFGLKLWCLASTDRYLFYAKPYCGPDTKLSNTGFGQGADVVLGLVEKVVCRVVFLLPLKNFLPLFLCLMSFQNVTSEVWLLLGKIV